MDSYKGELAALAVAFCWAISATSFTLAGRRVGSLGVNFVRLVLAIVLLGAFGLVARGRFLPTDATGDQWFWLGLSGLAGFTFGDLCLFRSMVLIGPRLGMLVMTLSPPMTALLAWPILGERLSPLAWLGAGVTLAGVAWVVLEERPDQPQCAKLSRWGILLGLGGALGQALGLVLAKRGMNGYDAFASTQVRIIIGLAGFIVLFSAMGWWGHVRDACLHRAALALTTLGTIFGAVLGVSLALWSLNYTQAGVSATITSIVPILLIPSAVLLHKERVTPRAVIGAVVAVAGVAILFMR